MVYRPEMFTKSGRRVVCREREMNSRVDITPRECGITTTFVRDERRAFPRATYADVAGSQTLRPASPQRIRGLGLLPRSLVYGRSPDCRRLPRSRCETLSISRWSLSKSRLPTIETSRGLAPRQDASPKEHARSDSCSRDQSSVNLCKANSPTCVPRRRVSGWLSVDRVSASPRSLSLDGGCRRGTTPFVSPVSGTFAPT